MEDSVHKLRVLYWRRVYFLGLLSCVPQLSSFKWFIQKTRQRTNVCANTLLQCAVTTAYSVPLYRCNHKMELVCRAEWMVTHASGCRVIVTLYDRDVYARA